MRLIDYIGTRIEAIKAAGTTEHDGIWRHETPEQRASRIDELDNLLDVMSAMRGYGRWLRTGARPGKGE